MDLVRWIAGWLLAIVMLTLRATCRVRVVNDPRPALKAAGESYVYSVLHAHQIAVAIKTEPNVAAMVSRSNDGDLLIPAFTAIGIRAMRGSNRRKNSEDRGGRAALDEMAAFVTGGGYAILMVDGPRGPRNRVRKGIAVLSKQADAAVVNVVAVPSRRWIVGKAWDRLQIPMPFCRIDGYFAEPLRIEEGESIEAFRRRIEESLNALEAAHDPNEAAQQRVDARQRKSAA